jgi:hypothetical protein
MSVKIGLWHWETHQLNVFEKRVLRRFCPNRNKMVRGLRKLHNVELHNLFSSPSIIRIIRSKTMRWAGHVTCTEENSNEYSILMWKPEKNIPSRSHRCRWMDNIKMDLRETECVLRILFIWLKIRQVEGSCEHCYRASNSIKCWEVLEHLSDWRLLKKDSAPWS